MNKLPDKPSALIRLAMADLEAVERDGRYVVHMETWHIAYENKCSVCLAGAVMAKTLETDSKLTTSPLAMGNDICKKLSALDSFRNGHIAAGLEQMDIEPIEKLWSWNVCSYHTNPTEFKEDMSEMADMLEGLEL